MEEILLNISDIIPENIKNFVLNNLNIIIVVLIILLLIRIIRYKPIKKDQMAVIYNRDKYICTKTKGYIRRFANYLDTYKPTLIDSSNTEYIVLVDKNQENIQYIDICFEISPQGYADSNVKLKYKINHSVSFDENLGKIIDSLITVIRDEAMTKTYGLSADNFDNLYYDIEKIKSSIIVEYAGKGIEIIDLRLGSAHFMQSEEDAEFYKSALKKDEARKRRNM